MSSAVKMPWNSICFMGNDRLSGKQIGSKSIGGWLWFNLIAKDIDSIRRVSDQNLLSSGTLRNKNRRSVPSVCTLDVFRMNDTQMVVDQTPKPSQSNAEDAHDSGLSLEGSPKLPKDSNAPQILLHSLQSTRKPSRIKSSASILIFLKVLCLRFCDSESIRSGPEGF